MEEKADVQKVVRKTAGSGKVDYAPPVVLHETSRSRLVATAWFIPRSEGTEFSFKLEGFIKAKGQAWGEDKAKTLTLSEEASVRLLKYLQTHLPIAQQTPGNYIMLRAAGDQPVDLSHHDPEEIVAALASLLSQEELVKHLATTELSHELSSALRGSIHIREMRSAVAELRGNLERGEANEQTYQTWCEKHCWAFGNAFIVRDEVRSISTGDNLDLLLPGVIAGYRDVVELKRPDKEVLIYDAAHRNFYFSSDVSKAIGQCHRYLDILHESAKNGLLDHKEVVAYHPRATIVIGRSKDWTDEQERALHGLNGRLHGISVMSYDHLLAQGERMLEMMAPAPVVETPPTIFEDDDIPF